MLQTLLCFPKPFARSYHCLDPYWAGNEPWSPMLLTIRSKVNIQPSNLALWLVGSLSGAWYRGNAGKCASVCHWCVTARSPHLSSNSPEVKQNFNSYSLKVYGRNNGGFPGLPLETQSWRRLCLPTLLGNKMLASFPPEPESQSLARPTWFLRKKGQCNPWGRKGSEATQANLQSPYTKA